MSCSADPRLDAGRSPRLAAAPAGAPRRGLMGPRERPRQATRLAANHRGFRRPFGKTHFSASKAAQKLVIKLGQAPGTWRVNSRMQSFSGLNPGGTSPSLRYYRRCAQARRWQQRFSSAASWGPLLAWNVSALGAWPKHASPSSPRLAGGGPGAPPYNPGLPLLLRPAPGGDFRVEVP